MHPLNEYLSGLTGSVEREELHRLVARWEWFTTARRARARLLEQDDPALTLPLGFWPSVAPKRRLPDESAIGSACAEDGGVAEAGCGPNSTSDPDPDFGSGQTSALYSNSDPGPGSTSDPASPGDALIDRFLERGGYRIVPADDAPEAGADTDADFDPDFVTEELAEIYRAQGHHERADEIFRKLNLRNS